MWTEPYLRLASHQYSPNLEDLFAHLTNNSVQKYSEDYDGNMYGFSDYCDNILGPTLQQPFPHGIESAGSVKEYLLN